jgi:hypothetical protein
MEYEFWIFRNPIWICTAREGLCQEYFKPLGADEASIPLLWIAAPLTGLIVQPYNRLPK